MSGAKVDVGLTTGTSSFKPFVGVADNNMSDAAWAAMYDH